MAPLTVSRVPSGTRRNAVTFFYIYYYYYLYYYYYHYYRARVCVRVRAGTEMLNNVVQLKKAKEKFGWNDQKPYLCSVLLR